MVFDMSASEKNRLDYRLSIPFGILCNDSTKMRVSGLLIYLYVADFSSLVSALWLSSGFCRLPACHVGTLDTSSHFHIPNEVVP